MSKQGRVCTIDGVRYESEYAAAKALGISALALRHRLRSPNFPECTSSHHPKININPRGQSCIINGIRYVSETGAARTLGISLSSLLFRLRSSNYPEYVSQYRPKEERRRHSIPCSIGGVEYRSIENAARNLGISDTSLRTRLASVDFPDYVCADIPKKPPKPLKYTVRGKLYRTLQEVANEEGVTRERIRQKMNSPSHPDYISADIPKRPPPPSKYMVKGKPYKTMKEIAKAEGLDMMRIRHRITDPSYPEYQRLYKRRT